MNSSTEFSGDYTSEELELFGEAYKEYLLLMQNLLEVHGWYDYIGEYYEAFVLATSKASSKGQYYTPRGISELLTRLVNPHNITCKGDTAYDPACGSARNLLDYQYRNKCMVHGDDVDESACKMAVVNFHSNKVVRGRVDWCNSLEGDYFGTSWIIFPECIYVTDRDWIESIESITSTYNTLCTLDSITDDDVQSLCSKLNKHGHVETDTPPSNEVMRVVDNLDKYL